MKDLKTNQRGAEAVIYLDKIHNNVIKDRVKKSYRIPELDEKIRKQRTKSEKKLLEKALNIINIPAVEDSNDKFKIKMSYIDGKKLSDNLDLFLLKKQKIICKKIGESTAKLHQSDIIHGDLTTSNMIYTTDKDVISFAKRGNKNVNVKSKLVGGVSTVKSSSYGQNFKVFFIDFGLGFISNKIEDKAVDIHLFKEALEARHFKNWQSLFQEFLKGYEHYTEHKKVLGQ
ncbi:MAG: RIO1 family regulatory kinase/ATPase, partial [Candidatus Pacearchaeota archaeon]